MKSYFLKPAGKGPKPPALKPITDAKRKQDATCPDGGWKRLSNEQKARLSILAREAYQHQKVQGMTLEEWRHEIGIGVCGVRISEAVNDHWAALKRTFLDLAGKHGQAYKSALREGDNKRRVAMHKLTGALAAKGLHISYAASICMTQFKCGLEEASAKQLWCLFYTVTNRRKNA